jgi:hypothetical protein
VDGPILNGVDNTSEYKTIELINMDKDLSTLQMLLTLGLNISLALTTEPHTLLVTNEAFPKCHKTVCGIDQRIKQNWYYL